MSLDIHIYTVHHTYMSSEARGSAPHFEVHTYEGMQDTHIYIYIHYTYTHIYTAHIHTCPQRPEDQGHILSCTHMKA